jgi:hypothetical protein
MVQIMRGQIPLKAAKLLLPIDGPNPNPSTMNTPKMMTSLDHYKVMNSLDAFLRAAKGAKKVHDKNVRKNGSIMHAADYDNGANDAYRFVIKNKVRNNQKMLCYYYLFNVSTN